MGTSMKPKRTRPAKNLGTTNLEVIKTLLAGTAHPHTIRRLRLVGEPTQSELKADAMVRLEDAVIPLTAVRELKKMWKPRSYHGFGRGEGTARAIVRVDIDGKMIHPGAHEGWGGQVVTMSKKGVHSYTRQNVTGAGSLLPYGEPYLVLTKAHLRALRLLPRGLSPEGRRH